MLNRKKSPASAGSRTKATKRTENDTYLTPQPLADAICLRLAQHFPSPSLLIEPSAGTGNFVRAARKAWSPDTELHAVELNGRFDKSCESAGCSIFHKGDWVQVLQEWNLDPYERQVLVFGNPPFVLATEHLLVGLDYLFPGSVIAFYLKMNFFGGEKRSHAIWSQKQLKHVIPVIGRPSFKKTENASNDTNEYGVFVWEIGYEGKPTVEFPHIRWKTS